MRQFTQSDDPRENQAATSRAVRVGPLIEVSGLTAYVGGEVMFPGKAYEQTQIILLELKQTLEDLHASLQHLTKIRIYLVEMDHWEGVAKACKEVLEDIRPAFVAVEIFSLAHEGLVIELEASAWVEE